MDHFAGMNDLKEVKVASEPQALLKVLGNPGYRFKRGSDWKPGRYRNGYSALWPKPSWPSAVA